MTSDLVSQRRSEESGRQLSPEQAAAAAMVAEAKARGLELTGPNGLLKLFTKNVLETALNEEITEHLGYEKRDPAGAVSGNVRNGSRAKTVLTEATGQVESTSPGTGPARSSRRSCASFAARPPAKPLAAADIPILTFDGLLNRPVGRARLPICSIMVMCTTTPAGGRRSSTDRHTPLQTRPPRVSFRG